MAGFGEQLQAAAPMFLGIGSQLSGRDPVGIARGMALMSAKQESDKRKAAIDNLLSGMGISGPQRDFLSTLPQDLQSQWLMQQMAPQEPVRGVPMGDRLVDPYTGATIADYSTPMQPLPPGLFGDGGGFNFDPYLTGGGTREDAMSGLDGSFRGAVGQMIADAPPEIQQQLRITSAFRSPDVQTMLFERAIDKYGSPEAARKWVAPPGRSRHNHGQAIDFKYLSPEAQQYVHANAERYGLHFPMAHEPWHVEPIGSRGGGQPVAPQQTSRQSVFDTQVGTLTRNIDAMTSLLGSGWNMDHPSARDALEYKRKELEARRDALIEQQQAAAKAAAGPGFDTDLANTYRDDMRAEPALALFADVQSGFDAIEQFYQAPGAVSDYALAVAFAKIVDPGSVAREGEVAAVSSAAGAYPAFEQALRNAITSEGKMPPEMRKEIADLGAKLYAKKADRAETVLESYQRRADRAKIPFDELWSNGPIRTLPDDWVSSVEVQPNAVERFAPPAPEQTPQPAPAPATPAPSVNDVQAAIDSLSPAQKKTFGRLRTPSAKLDYLEKLGKL